MTKLLTLKVTEDQMDSLKSQAMKHGYMNLSAYLRDIGMGTLESNKVKTLKKQNEKLMKLINDK